jgi:hypothetical protein
MGQIATYFDLLYRNHAEPWILYFFAEEFRQFALQLGADAVRALKLSHPDTPDSP